MERSKRWFVRVIFVQFCLCAVCGKKTLQTFYLKLCTMNLINLKSTSISSNFCGKIVKSVPNEGQNRQKIALFVTINYIISNFIVSFEKSVKIQFIVKETFFWIWFMQHILSEGQSIVKEETFTLSKFFIKCVRTFKIAIGLKFSARAPTSTFSQNNKSCNSPHSWGLAEPVSHT